ncbi:hypothetical protein FOMPIDRAFT_1160879 [Fomitopsis schrenkii]|uniref:Complex 1 LYR protein domain-containing protein n=1 Tax=Fomitopsis schrenkii TaxID=2126942 RepID=S8FUT7_FOMSC|nr:hypothetical protein FOMPIDRAFT_1160879 [Fomitopsis schrenkii]
MAAAPTKQALTELFNATMRTSREFSSYNFRNYFARRTKTVFQEIENETDPVKLSTFYNEKTKELAALKRGAIVNQLYGGQQLVVERQNEQRERSDN